MSTNRSPYVFISYSHDDLAFAAGFSARLAKANVPHFRDVEQIEWGDNIPKRVHEALERATHLVALISPGSEQSQWVAYETGYARGREVVLVPYLLHPRMRVPGFLANIRHLSTRQDESRFIAALVRLGKQADANRVRSRPPSQASDQGLRQALTKIRSKHPQVRRDGVEMLVARGGTSEMMEFLGHGEAHVRAAAASVLARLKHKEALPYLVDGLGYTSRRSLAPVIPNVEGLFAHYGREGFNSLLTSVPERLGYYEGCERWVTALASSVNHETVPALLGQAAKTGRQVFLEAAVQSQVPLRKRELLPAIESVMTHSAPVNHDTVAQWLSEASLISEKWAQKLVRSWLDADARALGPTKHNWQWWSVERLAKAAIARQAITATDLRSLAASIRNRELAKALRKTAERNARL